MRYYGFVGSRDFASLPLVDAYVRLVASGDDDPDDITVVSGGARGVDRRAEMAALECGMHVVSYRPRQDEKTGLYLIDVWKDAVFDRVTGNVFSKFAPAAFYRNGLIIKAVEKLYAFWDGYSTGTQDSIDRADAAGIGFTVVRDA